MIRTEITLAAAHMVHTVDTKCYSMHGHNWRAIIEMFGPTQDDGMIVDFGKVKELLSKLDHKVWLPDPLPDDKKMHEYAEVFISNGDAVFIPVPVITCEHVANFIADLIGHRFNLRYIKITLYESEKSFATAEWFNKGGGNHGKRKLG